MPVVTLSTKAFIGAEFSNSKEAKVSSLKFQRYYFENDPATLDHLVRKSRKVWFHGLLEVVFFTRDKHCQAVLSSDFPIDALMKSFLLYLMMLRSIKRRNEDY